MIVPNTFSKNFENAAKFPYYSILGSLLFFAECVLILIGPFLVTMGIYANVTDFWNSALAVQFLIRNRLRKGETF